MVLDAFLHGSGLGLLCYSVAEPAWHYQDWGIPRSSANAKGHGYSNKDAIHTIMMKWHYWSVHSYIPSIAVGFT